MKRLARKIAAVMLGLGLSSALWCPSALAATMALVLPTNAVEGITLYEDERPAMEEMVGALSELLAADLSDTPGVELVMENHTPEAEEAAKKWASVADYDGQSAGIKESAAALDMEALAFSELVTGEEKPLFKKGAGESAGPEQLSLLKQMYPARYYLCPTIRAIDEAEGVDAFGRSLPGSPLTKSEVKFKVECRLIDGETGKIVWMDTFKGSGKNSRWSGTVGGGSGKGGVGLGNDSLHKGLYTGGLEKVSRKIAQALAEVMPSLGK